MNSLQLPAEGTVALVIATVLITLTITLVFNKIFIPIFSWLFSPASLLIKLIYRWIAPQNPFSISLWNYKRHILRSRLAEIENPIGPSGISIQLEDAFAPLKLISHEKDDGIDLFDHMSRNHRSIILGDAGTGKTTLMKSLVVNVLKNKTKTCLDDMIPVFIKLRNLASKNHSIEDAIVATFEDFHFPGAKNFVNSAIEQGKLIIILDGLDEVGMNRQNVVLSIQNFCERDDILKKKNRIIVTCREFSYRTRDLHTQINTIVRVEPFSNFHMRKFLEGWPEHNGRIAIGLYSLIQSDTRIIEVCRNPLLLTILTGLYLETRAEDFKIPANRYSFYKAAIDELLIQRPGRKSQTQKYSPDLKLKLLAKISLDRLETVASYDDPEQIHYETINKHAISTFREKEQSDVRSLIIEMVEINGILKTSGYDSYTFSHRTFQEYLAACEALRTREIHQILSRFGSRIELGEVLLFYCSINKNLPQLRDILYHFTSTAEWTRAGQCLINMLEVPDESLAKDICLNLRHTISDSTNYDNELETLSSITQIHGDDIHNVSHLFTDAIDDILQKAGTEDKVSLESILGTKPELALRIIPALRSHSLDSVRRSGVRILRNIGTDTALDQLFEILNGPNSPERVESAVMIASLFSSRMNDLLKRITLLNNRVDKSIWPIEKYFPGRLAIPIIEALVSGPYPPKVDDPGINHAAKLIYEQGEQLKHWKRLNRDIFLMRLYNSYAVLIQSSSSNR